jgi:negative regulator of sigma E activity
LVLGVNDPLPTLLKLTAPVGVLTGAASVSATVAVHVVDVVAGSDEGEQDSAVVVVRAVNVIWVVPDDGPCAESPG